MIAEFNFFGIYLSTVLVSAVVAVCFHVLLRQLLQRFNVYHYVFHPLLFDTTVYLVLWGLTVFMLSQFAGSILYEFG